MCRVNIQIESNYNLDQIFLSLGDLKLNKELRVDIAMIAFELASNAFKHGEAFSFDVKRDGNIIFMTNDGESSINPLTEQETSGGYGLIALHGFINKYSEVMQPYYTLEGTDAEPNHKVSFHFNQDVGAEHIGKPCVVIVKENMVKGSRVATHITNAIRIPKDCPELTFFIAHGGVAASMAIGFLDEILKKTEKTEPEILIQVEQNDQILKGVFERVLKKFNATGKNRIVRLV